MYLFIYLLKFIFLFIYLFIHSFSMINCGMFFLLRHNPYRVLRLSMGPKFPFSMSLIPLSLIPMPSSLCFWGIELLLSHFCVGRELLITTPPLFFFFFFFFFFRLRTVRPAMTSLGSPASTPWRTWKKGTLVSPPPTEKKNVCCSTKHISCIN